MGEVTIVDMIAFEESYRAKPYRCSEGYATVGYGLKLSKNPVTAQELRDYYDFELGKDTAYTDLCEKIETIDTILEGDDLLVSYVYRQMDDARKCALMSMIYQMGRSGVNKFRKMLSAMLNADYAEAAKEALDSRWAKQTPERAGRVARLIVSADFSEYDSLCS